MTSFLPHACHVPILNEICDSRKEIYERDIEDVNEGIAWLQSLFSWYVKKIFAEERDLSRGYESIMARCGIRQ